MKKTKPLLLLARMLPSVAIIICASCSMPQVRVSTPFQVKERISLGEQKVVIYQVSDSMTSFSQQRYIPVYRFDLLNERGEVLQQYIGGVQEYISRVAGTLRPEQKALLQALPQKNEAKDSLTVVTTWSIPNYEGEISDISANAETIRTRYWSIDSVGSKKSVEMFTTRSVSIPYHERKLNLNRSSEEIKSLMREAEEFVYYDFKSFILTRLRNQ